jgi:putative peptidoglycan lipid II flippase
LSDRPPSPARAAGVVAAFTALSRLLGLARDQLLAWRFGTSPAAAAFALAFSLPNLVRRLFGEGALAASFLPRYLALRETAGPPVAAAFLRRVAGWLGLGVGGLTALLVLPLAWLAAAGPEPLRLTADLALRMAPYPVCLLLAGLAMGALHARGQFAAPAAAQLVLNLVLIAALLLADSLAGPDARDQVRLLAVAVTLGGGLQLAGVALALRRRRERAPVRTLPTPPLPVGDTLRALLPAAVGAALVQANLLLDRLCAAGQPAATAALYFAERLIYLPLGIFALAIGQVLLPVFARLASRGEAEALRARVSASLRLMAVLLLPAAAGLIALAEPIVRLLFQFGAFDAVGVRHTTAALLGYAPGLFLFSLDRVLVPLFHAHRDTRTPLRAAGWGIAANGLGNAAVLAFAPAAWTVAGLASTTVAAHGLYLALLLRATHRTHGDCEWREVGQALLRALGVAGAVGGVAWMTHHGLAAAWGEAKPAQAAATLTAVAAGAGTLLLVARLLRFPEWPGLKADGAAAPGSPPRPRE